MVASTDSNIYSPFYKVMPVEEGLQSSEEGSGLHSPVFGAVYPPPHGHGDGSFRYQHDQLDIQRAAVILTAPHFEYATTPLNVQQAPLLETTLELPSPSAQHVTFSHFSSRNHLGHGFPVQPLANSRLPPPVHGGGPVDYRYSSSSERRLPGGQSHDPSHSRHSGIPPGIPMDGDRRPPAMPSSDYREPSTSNNVASSSKPRKEISTVVIACRQCRGRKIRCDSTRPICTNCARRSNLCEYDAVPKRRGPDKRPGTRQRSCKKRPADGSAPPPAKRKRTTGDRSSDPRETAPSTVKENMSNEKRSPPSSRPHDLHAQGQAPDLASSPTELRIITDGLSAMKHEQSPTSRRHHPFGYDQAPYIKSSYPRQIDVNILRSPDTAHDKFPITLSPTVESEQRSWWDNFTRTYSLKEIENQFTYLFRDTGYWLSFLNLDFFIKRLWNDEERLRIQPAFIYAGLAMSTLMKSSEIEYKSPGRDRAMWLRTSAQLALEKAWSSEWVDASLAEAALILALFESSAHPQYSPERLKNSLLLLDQIVRNLGLTTIDAHDRDVSMFPADSVPMVHIDASISDSPNRKCTCIPADAAQPPNPFTSWSYILPWDSSWTDSQIRDEECRRLCWSALNLICNYISQCAAFDIDPPEFYLSDSRNYALLFPGEVLDRMSPSYRAAHSPSPKESVWGLYCRSMLLWTFCNRLSHSTASNEIKTEFIFDAWPETQALQDSLRIHDCNLDTALIYMCREYIYNTQITITQALRSLQGLPRESPSFKRKHAEEWLWYQDRVIQAVKSAVNHLGSVQGHPLTRRPFQVTWFSNQLSICLMLWNQDRTLKNALILAKSILQPVEVMNALWPCTILQRQSDDLRQRLIEACGVVGLEPPVPANYTLPSL